MKYADTTLSNILEKLKKLTDAELSELNLNLTNSVWGFLAVQIYGTNSSDCTCSSINSRLN